MLSGAASMAVSIWEASTFSRLCGYGWSDKGSDCGKSRKSSQQPVAKQAIFLQDVGLTFYINSLSGAQGRVWNIPSMLMIGCDAHRTSIDSIQGKRVLRDAAVTMHAWNER